MEYEQEVGAKLRPLVAVTSHSGHVEVRGTVRLALEQGLLNGGDVEFRVVERDLDFVYPRKKYPMRSPRSDGDGTHQVGGGEEGQKSVGEQVVLQAKASHVPLGILKQGWIQKHAEVLPSCLVLVCPFDFEKANANEQVVRHVQQLQASLNGHGDVVRVLLVLYYESGEIPSALQVPQKVEQAQDVLSRLGKQVRVDGMSLLYSADIATHPLTNIVYSVRQNSSEYYMEKIKRIQSYSRVVDRLKHPGLALSVRHNYKIAKLYEALNSVDKALKHYEVAYLSCLELSSRMVNSKIGGDESLFLEPGQYSSIEVKTVAEYIHYRICLIHSFSSQQNLKVVLDQFDRHIRAFSRLRGPSSIIFQHWEWMMRQHFIFAKLLSDFLLPRASSSPPSLSVIDSTRCEPVYHLRIAASYAIKRREVVDSLGIGDYETQRLLETEIENLCSRCGINVLDSLHYGGYPYLATNDNGPPVDPSELHSLTQKLLYLQESKQPQSKIALQLLEQVFAYVNREKGRDNNARLVSSLRAKMTKELMCMGKWDRAISELIKAVEIVHREKWFTLTRPILENIVECATQLVEKNGEDPQQDLTFDIDQVNDRRNIIHSALKLIALESVDKDVKAKVASSMFQWLHRPVKRSENQNAPNGAVFVFSFELDDLETPLVEWSSEFDASVAVVGSTANFQLKVKSNFACPTYFESLTVIFNDARYKTVIRDDGGAQHHDLLFQPSEEKTFNIAQQIHGIETPSSPDVASQTLYAIRIQLKLVGSSKASRKSFSDQPTISEDYAYLSGMSFWCSMRRQGFCTPSTIRGDHELLSALGSYRQNISSKHELPQQGSEDGERRKRKLRSALMTRKSDIGGPVQHLCIFDFESSLSMELGHDGCALVGELYPLTVTIKSDHDEQIENGELWVTCDPPPQSKSTPFFFKGVDDPIPLDGTNHQPNCPVQSGLAIAKGSKSVEVPLYCLFHSLPFPASSTNQKQCRKCTAKLTYTLPGTEVKVSVETKFEIPCCLPFASHVRLIPNTDHLLSMSPCYVDVDMVCSGNAIQGSKTLKIVDIVVEPTSTAMVVPFANQQHENSLDEKQQLGQHVSLFGTGGCLLDKDDVMQLHGGNRVSFGFDMMSSNVNDQAVLGCIAVKWVRGEHIHDRPVSTMYIPLPNAKVEFGQLKFRLETTPGKETKVAGKPFHLVLGIENMAEMAQELKIELEDSADFFIGGQYENVVLVGPRQSNVLKVMLVPLLPGNLTLPKIKIASSRLLQKYHLPNKQESVIFVAPNAV